MDILWFLFGCLIGIIFMLVITKLKSLDGILEIFKDTENGKYCYRFIVEDIDGLKNKTWLKIKVNSPK